MNLETGVNPPSDEPVVPQSVDSSVNRMAAGAGISLFGVGVGRGLDFIKQILMARLLGPDIFGLYAIGWNILRIIGVLVPFGLHNGVVHFGTPFWKKDNGALRSILTRSVAISFAIGWILAAILFILAPWITTDLFKEPEFLPLFRVFTLMLPFAGALRVSASATRMTQRMIFSVASEEIAQGALNLVLFIAFYLLGWELFGAIVATVLSFALSFALSLYFLWRLFRPAFKSASEAVISTQAMLAYSMPTALAGMFGFIISRVDRLFLGYFRPPAEVGIYQAAAQLSVVMTLVLNAFNMILMPMVAEQYHKRDMKQLEELYRINSKWGIYCVIPVVLVILFAASDVMTVLFGSEYASGATALLILTLGQFINIITGATGMILIMTGQQKVWFRLSMVIVVANLILNLTLIPRWGMNGAAAATAITVGGLFAIALIIVYRIHNIWPYDRRYLKGIFAAAMTAGLLFIVRFLNLPSTMNLLVTTLTATIGFLGILLALGLDSEDRIFIAYIISRFTNK